nr:PAS domain S-box protein [uncultured Draconibacterium sp.]
MKKEPKVPLPFSHFFQKTQLPILVISLHGKIVKSNRSAETLFKYASDELAEKNILELFSPKNGTKWLTNILTEIENNQLSSTEIEISVKTGERYVLNISFYPEYNTSNEISRIITIIHNRIKLPTSTTQSLNEEEKFRFLFKNMREGCAIHKLLEDENGKPIDYKIIEVNKSFEKIIGIDSNKACGQLASKLYGTGVPPFLKEYAEVTKKQKSIEFTTYFAPLDKHFQISASYIQPGYFATIFSDITEPVKDKEKLFESEEKFRSLYENAPLPYQSLNADGTFKDINPAWLRTLGYKREEVIGKNYEDFLHPDWKAHFHKNFPAFKKRGYVSDVQFRIRHKNGHYLHISFEGCIGYHPDGSFKQTYCVFKDISSQVSAEKKLIESEHKFRILAENTKDWEYWVDENEEFQFISNGCEQITGYSPNDFYTNPKLKTDILHPNDKEIIIKNHSSVNASEIPHHNSRFRIIHKNGHVVWIQHFCIPVYDETGKFIGRRGNNRDISEQVRHEKELVEATKKAEQSDRLKTAFLANMSHEIRTPMNGILGFIDLLQSPNLTSQQRENYSLIVQKSGKRLLNTINDIIEFSKIESDDAPIQNIPTNLRNTITDLIDFFKPQAEEKNIKLQLDLSIDADKTIFTDKTKLESILSNLIRNAIKFTSTGKIELGCKPIGAQIKFWVTDTGCGIEKDNIEQVFNRFTQAHIEITRGYEGSGLGLAICKAYAEMLGGKIGVESELGQGSTFWFTLNDKTASKQIAPETTTKTKSNTEKFLTTNNHKGTVLVAEDDIVSFQLIKIILEKSGFEVIHAKNGKEAVELYKTRSDITKVLMDLKMPELDGYEATKQIKAYNADAYIIAQTAFVMKDDEAKALQAGCDDFISKPINKAELAMKLLD